MEKVKERVRNWTWGPLDLSRLGLTELPELPAGLTTLYCDGNKLVSLPDTLPAGITAIDCSYNRLTRLPDTLPAGLKKLYCYNNQLTTLPDTLPRGLKELYCSRNRLTRISDTLPAGLTEFDCARNQLTTLPETLARDFTQFWCGCNAFPYREDDETNYEYIVRINAIAETASKDRIVQRCALYFEELAQKVWHPSRVEKRMLEGVDMEDM